MTDIEQKALALVNEVRAEWGGNWAPRTKPFSHEAFKALCRAIEQHEAFRREVSDAVEAIAKAWGTADPAWGYLRRFIIAKPDPLDGVIYGAGFGRGNAELLREAADRQGYRLELVKKEPSQ